MATRTPRTGSAATSRMQRVSGTMLASSTQPPRPSIWATCTQCMLNVCVLHHEPHQHFRRCSPQCGLCHTVLSHHTQACSRATSEPGCCQLRPARAAVRGAYFKCIRLNARCGPRAGLRPDSARLSATSEPKLTSNFPLSAYGLSFRLESRFGFGSVSHRVWRRHHVSWVGSGPREVDSRICAGPRGLQAAGGRG